MRIAIVGSGPSGFYAAEELLTQTGLPVVVDMFDRLPTPYGLVRGGVAPDHQKIKSVVKVYEKTAARNGFRFFGNVELGRDLSLDELRAHYEAVLFAVGAKSDRHMGIPGEDLAGSYAATAFVGWYNGHPDYRHFRFDLAQERVAIVGVGNVAVDVTRILASDPKDLEATDIAGYALAALKADSVKEIYLIGRRSVAQAAFSDAEVRELCHLSGADFVVDPSEVELDDLSREDLAKGVGGVAAKNNVQVLTEQSKLGMGGRRRKVFLKFLRAPVEVIGKNGHVAALKLEKTKIFRDADGTLRPKGTGVYEALQIGLLFRSVGYKGEPLAGVPYDEKKGTIPNIEGRVTDPATGKPLPGLYVVGWAKRGPTGVIGTNKPDSIGTVKNLIEDFRSRAGVEKSPADIAALLAAKKVRFTTFQDWQKLDRLEMEKGRTLGRPREKFTTVAEMLAALDGGTR